MKDRTIVLFEDVYAYHLYPFHLLRPVCDIASGVFTFYERIARLYPHSRIEILCRPEMQDLVRESGRNLFDESGLRHAERYVFINARTAFSSRHRFDIDTCCIEQDTLVYLHVGPGRLDDWSMRDFLDGECLEKTRALGLDEKRPEHRLFQYPWDIVNMVGKTIEHDAVILEPAWVGQGEGLLGDRVALGEDVRIDQGCILDSREGPVIIEAGARISQRSIIMGPAWIGAGTLVDGARIHGGVSIGQGCRIGGEVESSIIHPWTNKHHDGFLGHACVGSWVNIGAMTTNSDLRNDYGQIVVRMNGSEVHSGQIKLGAMIGDHSKLGIGLLVNTGTVIGVGSNLWFDGALIRGEVPCFVWGGREPWAEYRLNKFLDTMQTVMSRRGHKPGEAMRRRILDLHAETRDQRQGVTA